MFDQVWEVALVLETLVQRVCSPQHRFNGDFYAWHLREGCAATPRVRVIHALKERDGLGAAPRPRQHDLHDGRGWASRVRRAWSLFGHLRR